MNTEIEVGDRINLVGKNADWIRFNAYNSPLVISKIVGDKYYLESGTNVIGVGYTSKQNLILDLAHKIRKTCIISSIL